MGLPVEVLPGLLQQRACQGRLAVVGSEMLCSDRTGQNKGDPQNIVLVLLLLPIILCVSQIMLCDVNPRRDYGTGGPPHEPAAAPSGAYIPNQNRNKFGLPPPPAYESIPLQTAPLNLPKSRYGMSSGGGPSSINIFSHEGQVCDVCEYEFRLCSLIIANFVGIHLIYILNILFFPGSSGIFKSICQERRSYSGIKKVRL